MVSIFLLYLSVRRATGLLVFLYYFVLPSLNKVFILSYLKTSMKDTSMEEGSTRWLLYANSSGFWGESRLLDRSPMNAVTARGEGLNQRSH